jgi:hypothetical protein
MVDPVDRNAASPVVIAGIASEPLPAIVTAAASIIIQVKRSVQGAGLPMTPPVVQRRWLA